MIAVDWGTTNLRAYLVDEADQVRERRSAAAGVMNMKRDQFASALEEMIAPWLAKEPGPVMMCGMVGGRQGWTEVPYVRCPAGLDDVAAGVRAVNLASGRQAHIFPGLICDDTSGVPDVLRGEETQAIGAMPSLPAGRVSVWMPGTHCKHLSIRDGVIEGFATFMTGEIFSLLCDRGILGRLAEGKAIDPEAFGDGVRRASQPGGLQHHVFGVRSRALTGDLEPQAVRGYLSGILIGHELLHDRPEHPVYVLGEPGLADLYVHALGLHGIEATRAGVDLAAAGLVRLRHAMDRSLAA